MTTIFLSYKRLLFLFLLIWILWSALHCTALIYLGWGWEIALTDSVFCNAVLAAVCFATANSIRFYTPGKSNWQNLLIISAILGFVYTLIINLSLSYFFSHHQAYINFLDKSMPIRYGLAFLMIGWVVLLVWLWRYISNQKETDQRKAHSERLAKEAELSNLRQQLQPHFLFNSLNSISALVVTRPHEARKMIQQLSDFLRGTLKKDEQQQVSLEEELQQLQLYLEIEKVRFGHRLNTEVLAPENAASLYLPSLLLQPVVENAIKFGLYDTTDAVTISIQAMVNDNFLEVRVSNPFDSETANPRRGTGFGLKSIERRLYLLYARNDLLTTTQQGNDYITLLKIPQLP
ncbi:MAG: histidine kinase [Bacteroidota bacterium]